MPVFRNRRIDISFYQTLFQYYMAQIKSILLRSALVIKTLITPHIKSQKQQQQQQGNYLDDVFCNCCVMNGGLVKEAV